MLYGFVCMLIGVAIGWHVRGRGPSAPKGWTIVKFENGAFVRFDQAGTPLSVTAPPTPVFEPLPDFDPTNVRVSLPAVGNPGHATDNGSPRSVEISVHSNWRKTQGTRVYREDVQWAEGGQRPVDVEQQTVSPGLPEPPSHTEWTRDQE